MGTGTVIQRPLFLQDRSVAKDQAIKDDMKKWGETREMNPCLISLDAVV